MPERAWIKPIGLATSTQLVTEACVFGRNVLIARMAGAETLGEFAAIILMIRLYAMSTDLATERQLIQSDKGQTLPILSAFHATALLRSCVFTLLLLAMARWGTLFYNIPPAAFVFLALAAFMRGLTHQGYRLPQRKLDFVPAFHVEAVGALLGLVTMAITLAFTPSITGCCAALALQSLLHSFLSHIHSPVAYRVSFNLTDLKKLWKFGWPMLLTGMLMFWSMQGERVILATQMTATEFARFSMAFQLALVPMLVASRLAINLGLPALSQHQKNWTVFSQTLSNLQWITFAAAALFCIAFVLMANPLLILLFGADFGATTPILLLLASTQAVRLARAPHSIAAQAMAQTVIPLKANMVRASAVIAAVTLVLNGTANLHSLLACALLGEITAWVVQAYMIQRLSHHRSTATLQGEG